MHLSGSGDTTEIGSGDTTEISSGTWFCKRNLNEVEIKPASAYTVQEQNAPVAQTVPASLVSLETGAYGKAKTRLHFNTARAQPSAI